MEALKKKIEKTSSFTLALYALGAGISFLFLRHLWISVRKKTCHLAYKQVKLFDQINEARTVSHAIIYLNIDETVRIRGEKYDLDFNLMTKIEKKEQDKALESKNPFIPPFQTGLHITDLGATHRLLFNKFSIYKNHVLIVTTEFQPQQSRLNEEDFRQIVLVQGALHGIYYFNSGPESGASQKHKHIQILPSESMNLPLIYLINQWITSAEVPAKPMEVLFCQKLNFLHAIVVLPEQKQQNQLAVACNKVYEQLYDSVVKHPQISYNLIGTRQFMMMVPRKKEKAFEDLSINSVGFAGSLLFKNAKQYSMLQKVKPQEILADVSYADEHELNTAIEQLEKYPKL